MPETTQAGIGDGFEELVRRLDDSALLSFLDDDVEEIVAALQKSVRDSGGHPKASLTLTLAFASEGATIAVKPTVKVVLPKPVHNATPFWPTKDNRLSPQNPKQIEMPLREAAAPAALRRV